MRAVVLEGIGGPEELILRELPPPVAEEGQVIVEVKAAAINYLEVLIRRGLYPQMPELPWVPGVEIAGITEDGRRVLGLVRSSGGGYAEVATLEERWLFDLPDAASFEEGAAFLMAYLTAWIPLTRQVVIHPGSRVLVHSAAGGVGSAAVVVARQLGAEVVATAGSADKLGLPLALGATQAVTYDRLAEIEPVDVVFDPVGGQLFADSIGLLRPLGVAVAIGFAGGLWQTLDPALLVGRNVGVQGFYLGRLMQRRPDVVREAAEDLLRLWEAGRVRPIVGATFPLADAAEAHRLVENRLSSGKVVLVT
jgi:NADPH2:quinone reductase